MAKHQDSPAAKKALKRKRVDADEVSSDGSKKSKKSPSENGIAKPKKLGKDQNSTEKPKKIKLSSASAKDERKNGKKVPKKDGKKTEKIEESKMEEMNFKDRKKLRKQKKNVNFEVSAELKALWEELRKADIKGEVRTDCSDNAFNLVRGKASSLIFAHDTSRVFQTLWKYGTAEHKATLFEEVKAHLINIMKSKYAKFFVRKLLKYGTKEQRDFIFQTIQKSISSLVRHREAVSIVEYAYNNFANSAQRAAMTGGFYGPAFTIFKSPGENSLQKFVESQPERRNEVINHMKQSLSPLVEKSVLQHSFVHRLFKDYLLCASDEQRAEMIDTLHEHVVHMLHTHDGANVAMMCLWHGTAKNRKTIIKSFKSYVEKICKEEFGYMVMLALFDSVDDTKIVQKVIIDEMKKSLKELVFDRFGRKVILYLMMPRDPIHFHPDIVTVLRRGDNNKYSKKDAVIRQSELRSYISSALVKFVSENCRSLVADMETLPIVPSTIKYSTADPTAAMVSLALVAAEPFSKAPADSENSFHHIVDDLSGHYVLKRLINNDTERIKADQTVLFSEILVKTVSADSLKQWSSCNRGCFVLVSLLELNRPAVSDFVKNLLISVKPNLEQQNFKGAQVLLKKLNE